MTYQIAHLREPLQAGGHADLIIVPMSDTFKLRPDSEKLSTKDMIQAAAIDAGLAGEVCLCWSGSGGTFHFLAPPAWHPYFRDLSMSLVLRAVNRELTILV